LARQQEMLGVAAVSESLISRNKDSLLNLLIMKVALTPEFWVIHVPFLKFEAPGMASIHGPSSP